MTQRKKESIRIAKELFKASFTNSELDPRKIRKNVIIVRSGYKMLALDILKNYLSLLKRYLRSQTLIIESAEELNSKETKKIENYFEKKTGKALLTQVKQSPALIGGVKITLADTEWDYSIKSKIKQLKEALGG